jgi:glyoxylase-like metal-dependent hydrolase (beta-lactamase superfamily II)
MIVNTHFHHAGANAAFGAEATILAHHAVRERLGRDAMMYGAVPLEAAPPVAWPDLTFAESLTLHHGGEAIQVRHYPGAHTDGDVVVFFTASNVVATGDLFVPGLGACDVANGCRWGSFLAALRRLLDEVPPDAVIIPGHGRPCRYADLEAAYNMLTAITAHVRAHIEAGKTREALLAEGLPERWRAFEAGGLPADFFLSNLFDALSQNR